MSSDRSYQVCSQAVGNHRDDCAIQVLTHRYHKVTYRLVFLEHHRHS